MDNSTDLLLTNSIHANRPELTTNEKFLPLFQLQNTDSPHL